MVKPLRRVFLLSWGLIGAVLLMVLWLVEPEPGLAAREPVPEATLPIDRAIQTQAARDKGRVVRLVQKDGSVTETNMAEYLWSVVAAEMPASFEPEALKAQACAARTYTVRLQNGGGKHENADVCADSKCCQAYLSPGEAEEKWGERAGEYREKIARAVSGTDGLGVLYDGQPIEALFFSSAPGKTSDAVAVWGSGADYLKSVDSPEGEEVPNYRTTATLTVQEVKDLILAQYPGADLSGEPGKWIADIRRGESGAVASLRVGGESVTGNALRGALGLRSPAFTVACDGESFTFSVTGYGHGVGMSQYGANEMARQGADCRTILEWYYSGATVEEVY